jgi:hypothetical protein
MKRVLSLFQKVPVRRLSWRQIPAFLFLGVLALLGLKGTLPPATRQVTQVPVRPESTAVVPGSFKEMRPRAGDHLAFPRIGFRWAFDGVRAWTAMRMTNSADQASMMPTLLSPDSLGGVMTRARQQVRFLLHLVGPGGAPEIRQETTESQVRLNLRNTYPAGEYEWWVEAFLPGMPSVSSPRERFALTP